MGCYMISHNVMVPYLPSMYRKHLSICFGIAKTRSIFVDLCVEWGFHYFYLVSVARHGV